jgi:glycerol uptake facilitator-like aquaporin
MFHPYLILPFTFTYTAEIQEDYLLNWDMDGYFVDLTRRIEKLRNGDLPSGMLQELKSRALWRAVFAEFIATMVFLFIATMAAVPLLPVEGTEATIVKVQKSIYEPRHDKTNVMCL